MDPLITIATCSLNQWALDFTGNYERIKQSILEAKAQNARVRLGSELEIPGYSCQDHFFEADTIIHSWQVLAKLLSDPELYGIVIITGMPVMHSGHRSNCVLVLYNGEIVLVRPKMWMASDGNYRELRWFAPYVNGYTLEKLTLPKEIAAIKGQKTAPFGHALVETSDGVLLGIEICEELFVPDSPHVQMALDGADIVLNSSGSHHELRKLKTRLDLISQATKSCGLIYVYSNQKGCDGDRLYFDGSSMIFSAGALLAIAPQFSLDDVIVTTATVDLASVRSYRASIASFGYQAASSTSKSLPKITVDIDFSDADLSKVTYRKRKISLHSRSHIHSYPTDPIQPMYLTPQQEISMGPACWLWDYLRRSNQGGFFLALSGGIDSCSVAMITYSMCDMVCTAVNSGNKQVLQDLTRILGVSALPLEKLEPKQLCNLLIHTCYMATENSGEETRQRAQKIAAAIGSYHIQLDFSSVVTAMLALFVFATGNGGSGRTPRYAVHGGSNAENLALQNIQARLRMVIAYLFAALLTWVRSFSTSAGFDISGRAGRSLLVLGSSNVDECLRGYFTKYDCSSADLNPIGSISKQDLRLFIAHMQTHYSIPVLEEFLNATPSAELIPVTLFSAPQTRNTDTDASAHTNAAELAPVQSDEVEMGMTYKELEVFGSLRKIGNCGPLSMFHRIVSSSSLKKQLALQPHHQAASKTEQLAEIAEKVKRFFFYYAINRHKMTTLTPAYHAEAYSPDDNRFDHRPFLYNARFDWQFAEIDRLVKEYEQEQEQEQE